jgi:hypothetical protein
LKGHVQDDWPGVDYTYSSGSSPEVTSWLEASLCWVHYLFNYASWCTHVSLACHIVTLVNLSAPYPPYNFREWERLPEYSFCRRAPSLMVQR